MRCGERPVDVVGVIDASAGAGAGAGADGVVMELTEILLGISSGGVGSSFGFLRELFDEFWSRGAVVLGLSLMLLLLLAGVAVLLLGLVEVDFSRWRRLPRGLDFSLASFAPSFELLLLLLLSFWGFDLARFF